MMFLVVVLCAIWYHLHNLKNVKNTYGGVLLLVKLQATLKEHSSMGAFHIFKIAQMVRNHAKHDIYLYVIIPI